MSVESSGPDPGSGSDPTDPAPDPPEPPGPVAGRAAVPLGHLTSIPVPPRSDPRADSNEEPSAYEGSEVLPPPLFTSGRYQFAGPPATTHPPDPVVPFVAPPVSRRRRSDWSVLVVALIVAMVVLAGCCIAGYAVFVAKGAPTF